MGQKVSSNPRVRTNYGGPITHHQVHDPSYPGSTGIGESSSPHGVSSLGLHHLAMGSGSSSSHVTSNGHQSHQRHDRGSYPSTPYAAPVPSSQQHSRNRARSLGSAHNDGASSSSGLNIPGFMDLNLGQDSEDSSPEDSGLSLALPVVTRSRGRTFPFHAQSLPAHLFTAPLLQHVQLQGIKCPVCSKSVPPDDVECHLVICLTKPRIVYNEDVLSADAGECVICLDDMQQGDTIARLPCLCIYHKSCIDMWFERNRSCPEHPSD